jgi:tRNA pseudouridine38-40 synthase
MTKLAFLAGYHGAGFAGSQAQPEKRTVEGEFVAAGISLDLFTDAESAHFRTAGRTDKGVSARKQVISITTERPERAVAALNFHLPKDIWCHGAAEVPDDFYPRYAVTKRTYRYYFPYPLDIFSMQEAAETFCGTHSFRRFSKMEKGRDPERTVLSASVFSGSDGCPVFEVSATSFLWNMVRGMAGALQLVGSGVAGQKLIGDLLEKPGARVHPAPAEALVFWEAECGLSFRPMRMANESVRELGRCSVAARARMHAAEALAGDRAEELWRRRLIRDYANLR